MSGRAVLRGVDLEVAAGSTCALVGESGAGKTTLLRAIAGLVAVTQGTIGVDGVSLLREPPERRRLGVVFQEPRLFPSMSVVDNVAYGRRARGEGRATRTAAALQMLDEVGLGERGADRPSSLSGGEQQRVALARALCARPRLLLLDEPLSAVDGPRRDDLRALLRRLPRVHGVTTIVVTHDIGDAAALGDRIAVLDDGLIAQCSPTDELLAHPRTARVARLTGNPNLLHGDAWSAALSAPPAAGVSSPRPTYGFTIRPEHVRVGSRSGMSMSVVEVERRADHRRVTLASAAGLLVAHVPSTSGLCCGDPVTVAFPLEHLWQFPTEVLPISECDAMHASPVS